MILQSHILSHCMSSRVHFPVLSTKPLDLILTSSSALSLSFPVKLLEMIVSSHCFQFLSSHSHLKLLHQASLISMNLLVCLTKDLHGWSNGQCSAFIWLSHQQYCMQLVTYSSWLPKPTLSWFHSFSVVSTAGSSLSLHLYTQTCL